VLTCSCCCEQAKRLPEILSLVIGNMQTSRVDEKLDQELKGILRELEHMTLSNPTPADLRMNQRSGAKTRDRPTRDTGTKSASVRRSRAQTYNPAFLHKHTAAHFEHTAAHFVRILGEKGDASCHG
jgi:hypothetical protein